MNFIYNRFTDLTGDNVYQILRLRQEIFIVEQSCAYLDADGLDNSAWHLRMISSEPNQPPLSGYLRILGPQTRFSEPSIGRVVVDRRLRGMGYGKTLMKEGIARLHNTYGKGTIRISAQKYLLEFYTQLGFEVASEVYLEDGIPHLEMVLPITV